ncbi:MAG: hypothetical protein JO040_00630 [Gemmatimonadetes bacterium]|nr:hypothetical protein [Gemmatimonadota bacterium]
MNSRFFSGGWQAPYPPIPLSPASRRKGENCNDRPHPALRATFPQFWGKAELRAGLALSCVVLAACGGRDGSAAEHDAAAASRPTTSQPAVVDSALPVQELLRRFRADLPTTPTELAGVASRDSLVARYVGALQANDTSALEPLVLDRAEFAYLYYPTTPQSKPPYELPPALMWFQLQSSNRKGVFRAFRELGGKPLHYAGYRCDEKPEVQGENRIWNGCLVRIRPEGQGKVEEARLFGGIIERAGRFKFVSYANAF